FPSSTGQLASLQNYPVRSTWWAPGEGPAEGERFRPSGPRKSAPVTTTSTVTRAAAPSSSQRRRVTSSPIGRRPDRRERTAGHQSTPRDQDVIRRSAGRTRQRDRAPPRQLRRRRAPATPPPASPRSRRGASGSAARPSPARRRADRSRGSGSSPPRSPSTPAAHRRPAG